MIEVTFHFSRGEQLKGYITTAQEADIAGGKCQVVRVFKHEDDLDSGDNVPIFVRWWSVDYVERT